MFPELFHIGRFAPPTYGLLVALGVLAGLLVSVRNSQKEGIDPDDAWNLGVITVLSGIVGAKLLMFVNEWDTYIRHREMFTLDAMRAAGVFSGGFIAAMIAAAWYMRRRGMPAFATCDAFMPGLALGHSIGRLGCFAAGCCYGKPTGHWWGVTFTNPIAHLYSGTPLNEALQPTQLFESAIELAIFFILMWMFKRKKFDGQVFAAYLFLYGIARFFLEFIRDDPGRGSVFGAMSGTQLISLCLVMAGGVIWWLRPGQRLSPVRAH